MSFPSYRAREHYQKTSVAGAYDDERTRSWIGRQAYRQESKALDRILRQYLDSPGRVLDLPCGTGRMVPILKKHGLQVTGGDISEAMMAIARARFAEETATEFLRIDAEKIDFPDAHFDYLVSFRFMCHLPPETLRRVLDEMIRVTRKLLVLNFHFEVFSPLYLLNRLGRPQSCPRYPLRKSSFRRFLEKNTRVEVLGIHPLSFWERSSCLLVLRKKISA
ncbi:MAG: class I SAM-dependent methyltransferase [Candidatus Omnitrophota bacterium]